MQMLHTAGDAGARRGATGLSARRGGGASKSKRSSAKTVATSRAPLTWSRNQDVLKAGEKVPYTLVFACFR